MNETRFPETYGESIDGAVLLGRLVADGGRVGSDPRDEELPETEVPDELARVARRHGVLHLHDPDTPVLRDLSSHEDGRASRACRMSAALAVELPIRAEDLLDAALAERFVRATLRPQIDVTHPAPPYFEIDSPQDGWLDVNIECVRIARRLRPGKRLAVFVRGSLNALLSGALASAAPRYATVLPEGALVFLGVAGLHPEESEPDVLARYLSAVEAFDNAGFDVVADRVDALAPAAVAFGAVGAAGGTRIYRTIPPTPFWENEYSVKILVKYLCPVRGDRMRGDVAQKRLGRGSIEPCPVTGCSALDEPLENSELRCHHGHLTQHELAQARDRGAAWVARRYENSPIKAVRALGHAVRIARRLSAEA